MADITFTYSSSRPTSLGEIPCSYKYTETNAVFWFWTYTSISALSSISARITHDGGNMCTVAWFWTEVKTGYDSTNSTYDNRRNQTLDNFATLLKNDWTNAGNGKRKYLAARAGCTITGNPRTVAFSNVAISGTGTLNKPNNPTIMYPAAASATSYNNKPYFKMKGTDPQSDKLTYQYKIGDGSWTSVTSTSLTSGTEKEWQRSTTFSAGTYTLYVRTYDGSYYSSSVSRSFKYASPASATAGNEATAAKMSTLKTYIDNLSTYYGTGSGTTITAPSAGGILNDTNWTNYATKINATPHISGLAKPSAGATATAAYYNSYVTKLKSG